MSSIVHTWSHPQGITCHLSPKAGAGRRYFRPWYHQAKGHNGYPSGIKHDKHGLLRNPVAFHGKCSTTSCQWWISASLLEAILILMKKWWKPTQCFLPRLNRGINHPIVDVPFCNQTWLAGNFPSLRPSLPFRSSSCRCWYTHVYL